MKNAFKFEVCNVSFCTFIRWLCLLMFKARSTYQDTIHRLHLPGKHYQNLWLIICSYNFFILSDHLVLWNNLRSHTLRPWHTGLSGWSLFTSSQENKCPVLSPSFVHCRHELFVNHDTKQRIFKSIKLIRRKLYWTI